ncbi:ubiquinol-cytochrome c reductase iron-sulfur subunit [Aliikangiella marina]|uniref:Ubiquinol-cytochrome c reductase iron-sulfur subunit n=1 Tax=Aliikangiella marina TaxID=1712262 RepID=A0A545T6J5_9GAMM|nr:ubiquinol-cytochrome c reductase iron-sulfur subunit [Aliikangiella marina]TQV72850.1 ubiquinol-cytochrome c reductase iron-sulfur subunit [Aliikangiella marina]
MSNEGVDTGKRRFLTLATAGVGAVGAAFVAVPFIGSWNPSAKAKAAGAPVEVDLSKLEVGQMVKVEYRGKPVFVVKRSDSVVESLKNTKIDLKDPKSENPDQQPEYVDGEIRSIRPDIMVLVAICTHLGCVPQHKKVTEVDWGGGFFCPCHGSQFDLAGRVFSGVPASKNLEVPPYSYLSDDRIIIGVGQEVA